MPVLSRIFVPLVILALGLGAWKWLSQPVAEPKAERREPQKLQTSRLELKRTGFPVILDSQGTVRAHHSTTLTAQVAGMVKTIGTKFEDGAFFAQGDVLIELDPADFQATLTASESRLARAEALLAQEEARAKQARLNWEDIGYKEEPSPLVLRVPQLKEANANVVSARADLDQARRNLARAQIRAPFDGRVKVRSVGLGQAIGGTTALGEIFATDYAEVRLPLAPSQISFVKLPSRENDHPVKVTLTDALETGTSSHSWAARIVRTEGELDETSRELFAIARIDDPFGLVSGNPELRIGQPVRAKVEGVVLEDVFVIPRSALRGLNEIFLIEKETVTIQRTEIQPIWSNSEVMVIRDGLADGDWLATSRLPYAPNGAPVEIVSAPSAVESTPQNSSAKTDDS